jgi:prepilin-type N-terminal cleavage/methylation domain-containing protein
MISKLASLGRKGFTLMEMMVVLVIIGILSTYFIVSVPEWIDKGNMTASEQNMSRIYMTLTDYKAGNKNVWPREQGQKFFLSPWRAKIFEHTPQAANMYFSPSLPFEELVGEEEGITIVEYLDDWDSIGPGYTSYAGFSTGGDNAIRASLRKSPGSTTILSDGEWIHRSAMIYMRGDGAVARYNAIDIEEMTGIEYESEDKFYPGPGCGIPQFETVSND